VPPSSLATSTPILAADGTIYVGTDVGKIYALRGK
jgi:outer membrane protein assembly factor BamB